MNRAPDSTSSEKQHRVTILVVEDEPLMLRLLVKFFSRHGYQVLEAADGEQAIEVYRRQKMEIDAVLLDSRLPRSTGADVFERMKAENPAVKVVMGSGYLEPQTKTEMTLAGIKRFVNKPYYLDQLLEIFEDLIKHQ